MADVAYAEVERASDSYRIAAWPWRLICALVAVACVFGMVSVPRPAAAATGVSKPTVSITPPSSAANAVTSYLIGFKTSASGALSQTAGSTITVVLPASTGLDSLTDSPVNVGTNQVGACGVLTNTSTSKSVSCSLFGGETIGASTTVQVALNGITNPPAGGYTLSVSTTSDTTSVASSTYTVGAVSTLTGLTVAIAPPSSAANATTSYALSFMTSGSGALSQTAGSTITVVLPASTGLGSLTDSPVNIGTNQVGACGVLSDTSTSKSINCSLFGGETIPASTTVQVTLNGITNPPAGGYTLSVSTTSDTKSVTSSTYTVGGVSTLTGLTVAIAPPSSAANAVTSYAIAFKTSTSGALAQTAGSTITVVLPASTGLGSLTDSPVNVGTNQVGACGVLSDTSTNKSINCSLFGGETIPASSTVQLVLNGITNPPAGGYTLSVTTTSDTTSVTSSTFTVSAVSSLTGVTVGLSSNLTGATNVTYTLSAKTSATGALAQTAGSTFTVVLPTSTGLGSLTDSPLNVGTNQVGACGVLSDTSTSKSINCNLFGGETIPASTTVQIVLNGLTNPASTNAYSLALSSSSDTVARNVAYCVAAAGVPCISGISPTQGPVGTGVTITGINLSGATKVQFHGTTAVIGTDTATQITTTVPAGATTGTITVVTGGGTATSGTFTVILPPVANAGPDQSVASGATATLDASGSSDPQGEPLSFAWSQVSGPTAVIEDPTSAKTLVTMPTGPATVTLQVKVTNSSGLSNTDTVVVTVKAPK